MQHDHHVRWWRAYMMTWALCGRPSAEFATAV
jgi:hypothetical protein